MDYPIFVLSSQFFPKIYLVVFYNRIIHIYSLFPFTKSATHIAKIVGITNTKLVVNGIRNLKDLVISISIILVLLVNFLRGSKNIRYFGRNIKYHFERNCRLYLMLLCYLITKHITIRNASWWYKKYQMMCRWGLQLLFNDELVRILFTDMSFQNDYPRNSSQLLLFHNWKRHVV